MKVLTLQQIKDAENLAAQHGLFSYEEMMSKAGKAVFSEIISRYDVIGKKVLIIVGSGNNGGDGLVVSSLLKRHGAFVTMYLPFGMPKTDVASTFVRDVNDIPVVDNLFDSYDFYIDALFGIGLNRNLSPDIENIIDDINDKSGIKIAVDIPSGVFSDGGMAQTAFKSDLTVSFIGYKLSELSPPTSSYCGEIVVDTLGIDVENNYSYSIIERPKEKTFDKNSHKGTFGTALLVCGSYGMCGAEILSARAAAISGAGIVKCIVCDKNYAAFTGAVPEAVTIPVETSASGAPVLYEKTIFSALSGSSAILLGCGIGKADEIKPMVKRVLSFANIPVVLDADGINAIAGDISILRNVDTPLILTPHPGEMARMLGTTTEDVQKHRVLYAKRFACEHKCVLVLKGANTIVASPNGEVYYNITGNYGMAKGGSGDILSGILVALLANGYDAIAAALTAVYVHGKAGDRAAEKYTKRTMLPSDLLEELKYISF